MKRNLRMILLCLSCMVFLGSGIVFAMEEISVTNHIETGVIDIELNEYQEQEDGTLTEWEDNPILLPGSRISKIPRIENLGYECYVRASLDFSLDELEDSYFDMGEHWIYGKDGYWYYTEVLKSGTYTDIFQGIQVPDDFSQEYEGQTLQLKIDVDAIQTNNFIPDYDSEKPWGDVEIQACIQEAPYTINSLDTENPKQFEIQYDKTSKELIKNEEDFFSNIPTLFPGDVYTDILDLTNTSSNPIKLYFHTYSEASDLLDQIKLTIVLVHSSRENLIYEGSLNSKELEKQLLLTEIYGNGKQQLRYTLEVPKELDNQYTLLKDQVRWMFSVEEIGTVQTGDTLNITPALLIMLISGVFIFALLLNKLHFSKK